MCGKCRSRRRGCVESKVKMVGNENLSPLLATMLPLLRAGSRRCRPQKTSRFHAVRALHDVDSHVDSFGIPTSPTWSVNELLSSYPTPTLTPQTIHRLHELSALSPPPEGSPELQTLTTELTELVRLVEAVKLVEVDTLSSLGEIPDARIWNEGAQPLVLEATTLGGGRKNFRHAGNIVKHARRWQQGYYIVETTTRGKP